MIAARGLLVVSMLAGAGLLTGCRSKWQVPTAIEQQAILTTLVQYEQSRGGGEWSGFIRPAIQTQGRMARAEYKISRKTTKLVGAPIIVELEWHNHDWSVTSEQSNWPWWWHMINHTVVL